MVIGCMERTFRADLIPSNIATAPALVGLDWVMTNTERGNNSAAAEIGGVRETINQKNIRLRDRMN